MSRALKVLGVIFVVAGLVLVGVYINNRRADPRVHAAEGMMGKWPKPVPVPKSSPEPVINEPVEPYGTVANVIRIPKLGVKFPIVEGHYFVEGDDLGLLRKGVGHYSDRGLPGQVGNYGLAGHRCCESNGEPFKNLNLMRVGDAVVIETAHASYHYSVVDMPTCDAKPIAFVDASRVDVLNPTPCTKDKSTRKLLTLTTCEPYGYESTKTRLIVWAELTSVAVR